MLDGAPETLILQRGLPRRLPPLRGRRRQGVLRGRQARLRARPDPHAPAQRPAPGPPHRLRADLEHVPRPPHPRVRGARSTTATWASRTSSCTLDDDICRRKVEHLMTHFGTQVPKRWFKEDLFSGPAAAARHGVQLADLLRRGVLLPQGGARVSAGETAYELMRRLFPLCRSLTGDGVRATFDVLARAHPDHAHRGAQRARRCSTGRCPTSGTSATPTSRRPTARASIDFRESSLHVVGYSEPVRTTLPLEQLRERLFTLPEQPDLIPYRTSYYSRTWGFCLPHNRLLEARAGRLRGRDRLDARPGPPHLRRGRARGRADDEVLISTYVCHPSLANDNLSGHRRRRRCSRGALASAQLRHTYRFVFAPGTIGPLTLAARQPRQPRPHRARAHASPASATPAVSPTSAAGAATPASTARSRPSCATRASRTACSTGTRGAATSGSSARPASTCRSGR